MAVTQPINLQQSRCESAAEAATAHPGWTYLGWTRPEVRSNEVSPTPPISLNEAGTHHFHGKKYVIQRWSVAY